MKTLKLKNIIKKIFIKNKLSNKHALICAEALINAELVGAPSHGLSRLKMYCDRISKKVINPKPKIRIKKISESVSHIDACSLLNLFFIKIFLIIFFSLKIFIFNLLNSFFTLYNSIKY